MQDQFYSALLRFRRESAQLEVPFLQHILSAQELSSEILDSTKAKFKSKPIIVIVKEVEDEIELSNEMKFLLNDRLKEDEATYLTLDESMDRLKGKHCL